jgi:hypothetical protein
MTAYFVIEGAVLGLSSDDRNEICTSVVQQVKKFNLPLCITTLERSLGDSDASYYSNSDSINKTDHQKEEQLKKLISSIHSITGKKDLLHKLR